MKHLIIIALLFTLGCKKEEEEKVSVKQMDEITVSINSTQEVVGTLKAREPDMSQTTIMVFDKLHPVVQTVKVEHRDTYEIYLKSDEPYFSASIEGEKAGKKISLTLSSGGWGEINRGF